MVRLPSGHPSERPPLRRALPLTAGLLLGGLLQLLAACGRGVPAGDSSEPVPLAGSTSSFAANAYWRWFNQLAVRDAISAELTVTSSGESIRSFLAGRVDFAGTDSPPSPAEIRAAPRGLLAFPVTGGAIAVAYNLPGCALRLSRAQLVAVFLGRIRDFHALGCRWQPITLLHRGDASGSTANLTASLAAFGPEWRRGPGVGRQVAWPVGVAVRGSDGMATALAETVGSLGYIEAAYVRAPLQAAALENQQGRFLRPTAAAAAEALAGIQLDRRLLGSQPDPASGYPIVNLNWMLVQQQGLGTRQPALARALRSILSQAGQDDAELLGYVPLPPQIRVRARKQLEQLRP